MIRAFAGILIVGCCSLLGFGFSARSIQRLRALQSVKDSLHRLANELETHLTPIVLLLRTLRQEAAQPAAEFYSNVLQRFEPEQTSLRLAWEQALEETESLCLRPEELRALQSLGPVLGRSEAEAQAAAIGRVCTQLSLFLELERKERAQKGRVSAALGIGAGVTLLLLLI